MEQTQESRTQPCGRAVCPSAVGFGGHSGDAGGRQLLGLEVTQGMLVGVSSPMTQQGVSARPSGTVPEPSPDTLGQTDTVCGLLERRNYRKKNPPRVI